jgi:hypothetical protein
VTVLSRDGGQTWKRVYAHLSRCSGGNSANGADFERASDPWLTFAPDGTLFQSGLSFNASNANQAVLVARSGDGGETWSEPTTLIFDTDPLVGDDKGSITADPHKPGFAYAIWSRYIFADVTQQVLLSSPTWLSRTTDNGATWEPARVIYTPPAGFYALGHEIVSLRNGTLVDTFVQYDNTSAAYYTIASSDQGVNWSAPRRVDDSHDIGVIDVKTGELVRNGVANIAADPATGTLYFVWMDARFSSGVRDGIAFSSSADGGMSWSPAVQINQAANVQAFAPAVAVASGGRIAVTYYDFRNDNADPKVLLTSYWRLTSQDGGRSWQEIRLSAPFDLRSAPKTSLGYVVTDYEGLAASANSFFAFFVTANDNNRANPTDVFVTSTESGIGVRARNNPGVEINFQPRTIKEQMQFRRERPVRLQP